MYAQRPDAPRDRLDPIGPWVPGTLDRADLGEVRAVTAGPPAWLYIVVDEIIDAWCVLTVDPWPSVDRDGRLLFPADQQTVTATVDAASLHRAVSAARESHGQAAPQRPIRIGDVFAASPPVLGSARELQILMEVIRAPIADPGDGLVALLFEGPILDITADARDITHAAAQEAATGVLNDDDIERLGLRFQDTPPPPDPTSSRGL